MSVKQMALVWEYEFKPAHQQIMLALADHAHDDGTEIRPSVGRLAWKTGYSERQVQRNLKELRNDLKILVLQRKGGGRGNPNVYRFDWTKGVKKSPFIPKGERVTSENGKGDISDIKGDTATSPEPSLEPSSLEPSRRDAKASPKETINYFELFARTATELGYEVTPEDRKELPGNLKKVAAHHDDMFMRRVVRRCLAARADRQYPLSPQKARDELLGDKKPVKQTPDASQFRGGNEHASVDEERKQRIRRQMGMAS